MPKTISVIIPVYNSGKNLSILVHRINTVLNDNYNEYEIILVNDGSSDNSWQDISHLIERYPWIRGIDLMRNYGQHNALLCGIRQANNEYVVTMDDDLQNPPEEIPRLINRLEEGFDVVYGAPLKQRHGLWRNASSLIVKLALYGFMGVKIVRHVSAFRAFRLNIREAFRNYEGTFVSIDVLLTWGTKNFSYVLVKQDRRLFGDSNYNIVKLISHAINMMTGFSTLPLQVASFLGFLCTIFGLIVLTYVLFIYFVYGSPVQGFTFISSIIAIFSGAQLLSLGIIGEYLARMYFRTLGRPTYTIREVKE